MPIEIIPRVTIQNGTYLTKANMHRLRVIYRGHNYTIRKEAQGYIFVRDDGVGMCGHAPSLRKLVIKAHVMMSEPVIVRYEEESR